LTKKPPNLAFVSALQAARTIRKREISSLELTKRILERINQYNSSLNAICTLLPDEALSQAHAADDALTQGELWGPLHGVPCTVKDTFETTHVLTTAGSPALATHIPKKDAIVVARLRAAGAIIIGHTNVPIMANDWQSYNEIFGVTNNPWDLKRTPGGSTGGGAAALAAGLSYLSIGSDIGGSIRIPAHFCGVYGHKPSLNVIPRRGHIPPPPGTLSPPADLGVVGPLARNATDLKVALELFGGPDPEEAIGYRWSLPPARGTRLSDYQFGYVVDDPLCPVSSDVKEVIMNTIDSLQKVGAHLEEGWPPGVNPADQYATYRFLFDSTFAYQLDDTQFETMRARATKQDGSDDVIQAWAWTAPHKHFQAASRARLEARAKWQKFFCTFDAFLLPTAFIAAFPHDHSEPQVERRLFTSDGQRSYYDLFFWIVFATLTGLPATTAPIGLTRESLPVGIQIIGPYLEDATPIDIAGKLADVIGGFKPPKGY